MRLHRRNLILGGLLGALVIANLTLDVATGGDALPEPLFSGLDPARAARVTVEGPDGTLRLERGDSGWVLASLGGFPALDWTVEDQLRRVAGVSDVDLVSESAAEVDTYGLGEGARRVTIEDIQGSVLADFHQGLAEGAGTYLRPAEGEKVFRAPAVGRFDIEPSRWFDPHLILPSPDPVTALRWTSTDGVGELSRDGQGRWVRVSDGAQVQGALVDTLLATLRNLLFSEVQEGSAPEDFLIELLGADGDVLSAVALGPTEGDTVAAANGDWDGRFEVRLPASSAERLRAGLMALLR